MSVESVPDLMEFRTYVDEAIPKLRDRNIVKMLYLSASRANELCEKVSPWAQEHDHARALGMYAGCKVDGFEHTEIVNGQARVSTEKVLLLKLPVEKRHGHSKKNPDALTFKTIALPLSARYEPWSLDLLKSVNTRRRVGFDVTRQGLYEIIKRNLRDLDPSVHPHSLRHWRITHLVSEYGFDPSLDAPLVAGWSFKSVGGSPMTDVYLHLDWRRYFPKLLRPMAYHAIRPLDPEKEPKEEVDPALFKALQELSTTDTLEDRVRKLKAERLTEAFLLLARQDPEKARRLLGIPVKEDVSTKAEPGRASALLDFENQKASRLRGISETKQTTQEKSESAEKIAEEEAYH